jgi:hypothetical protein
MELFVHRRGKDVELHQVEPGTTVAAFIEQLGSSGASMWLEDQEDELLQDQTLGDAGVEDRANVHVGTCRKVDVSVRFNMQVKNYEVPPSATLRSVYDRATSKHEGFDFSEHDKAEYTLQVQGTTEQPDLSRHVGVFANDHCTAAFDLVLQERFQGS